MAKVPTNVYWMRRGLVLLLALLLIAVVAWVAGAFRGDDAATTGQPSAAPLSPATTEASMPANPTAPESSLSSAGTATPPVGPTSSASVTAPSSAPVPSAPGSGSSAPAPTSASPATTAAPQPPPTTSAPPPTPACTEVKTRVEVSGPKQVKVGTTAELVVTTTNASAAPCVLTLSAQTFRLVITSGSDEIWSTRDCPGWGPEGQFTVAPGGNVEWRTTWDRHRSRTGCRVVPDDLLAGTYVATATLTGSTPGRHVMLLVW